MPTYFDFEVSLCEVKSRIWRRFLLRSTASFKTLHLAIQEAAGWWNYHLFAFHETPDYEPGGEIAGVPNDDAFVGEPPVPDAAKVKVSRYFGNGKHDVCYYQYDFGDDWWHEVALRGVVTLPETFKRRLLGGARAFPHEDCGGLPGYEECVKVARGKTKGIDDPEGFRTWLGSRRGSSLKR